MKKSKLIILTVLWMLLATKSIFAATATTSPTPTSSTIEEQVKRRIDDIKNSPKAYVGTVTDKTQNTLQIRTEKEEIKMVSADPATTIVKKDQDKSTPSKYDDVAIGDFIIAIGFRNGNDVLNAKKIIITSNPTAPKRKIIKAKIASNLKNQVKINAADKIINLKFPKRWQGPEKKELLEGDLVVVFGEFEDNNINLRSIFKI